MIKSGYKSAIKSFEQAIEAGNMDEAKKLFSEATKKLIKLVQKVLLLKTLLLEKNLVYQKKLNAAIA